MEKFDYSGLLHRADSWTINLDQDIDRINSILLKYNLKVDAVIPAPSVISFIVNLDVNTKVNQVMKLEPNFGIACRDNNVRAYLDGDKLFIEKKTPKPKESEKSKGTVRLGDLYSDEFKSDNLRIMIGINNLGERVYYDMEKAPHMLVAGTTGSGKSVFLNSLILSLFMNHPENVDIIGIDPKGTEFNKGEVRP